MSSMQKHCTQVPSRSAKRLKTYILKHQEMLEISQKWVESELTAQSPFQK